QPADGEDPAVGRVLEQIRILFARVSCPRWPHDRLHHHRHIKMPHDSELRTGKSRRSATHDGEDVSVQTDFAPDRIGSTAEARLPEVVRDHGYWMRARCRVVARREQPSARGMEAEKIEKVSGDN